MTIKNQYAKAHVDAEGKKAVVAQMIRKGLTSGDWQGIAEGYGELLSDFGKQTRIPKAEQKKGQPERTPTTPADSYQVQLQAITDAMAKGGNKKVTSKLKAALIETDDGDDVWGLVAVEGRKQSKRTSKKLETIRSEYVELFSGRTRDEKASELERIAEAFGIPFNRASVIPVATSKSNKRTSKKSSKKAA